MSEDLEKLRGYEGIELSVAPGNSLTIDGVTIRDDMIAVCKADSTGLLSVKYLKKSHTKQFQPIVEENMKHD